MLPLGHCPPKVPSPPPITATLLSPSNPEAICEAAARLLFMNVKWAKNVPAFTTLSLSDRLLLLEESWRDLFVIGSAQFLYPLDLKVLENSRTNLKDVELFEKALEELARIRPDSNEFACLRAIVLFKTVTEKSDGAHELRRLQDLPAVAALQDHSQAVLSEVSVRFVNKIIDDIIILVSVLLSKH